MVLREHIFLFSSLKTLIFRSSQNYEDLEVTEQNLTNFLPKVSNAQNIFLIHIITCLVLRLQLAILSSSFLGKQRVFH